MTDEQLERALDVTCPQCGMGRGLECVVGVAGLPLSDVEGIPVHPDRWLE